MFLSIKKQIPNLFTLGNLTCGVFAILLATKYQFENAAYLILFAAILDFFDGFLARLLKVSGEMGKQLDSLADCVTFGVAPSIMLLYFALGNQILEASSYWAFILLAIFSAYRLAKFNIDTRQSESFIGVPTPITGIMVASWAFIQTSHSKIFDFVFSNPISYIIFCVIISLLLVSEIPLVSLKFKKGKQLKDYSVQLIIAAIGVISILFFQWLAVPIIYLVYVLSSVFVNFAKK